MRKDPGRVDEIVYEQLSSASAETNQWPTDSQLVDALVERSLYWQVAGYRIVMVLSAIEKSLRTRKSEAIELPSGLTIEHIMPETLSEAWRRYLGLHAEEIHSSRVHTLPNLTLVAGPSNSGLQNLLFEKKCTKWYTKSNVSLTKEVSRNWKSWKESQMKERASLLTERAIALWPHPA